MNTKYNLVHITTSGEYKAPLVASQLFDQAETQATVKEGLVPQKVEAWILGTMREYWDKAAQEKVTSLKKRCPHINIRMINGIGKLKGFPAEQMMIAARKNLGTDIPVIYHCRGESAALKASFLKSKFPNDKIVLDVRGFWPAESLYNKGIEYPELATGADKTNYDNHLSNLKKAVAAIDGITTVSQALRQLLIDVAGAPLSCCVVPCCVTTVPNDSMRAKWRNEWGIKDDEKIVVYSGTTAAYQHLGDLTIPFMKEFAAQNPKVKLAFFSSEIDKIKALLKTAGIDENTVLLKKFTQQEVAGALTACDAGILIRKPTLVNRVANPVKIAEYLAAGLPIIIEKGVGGVSDEMFEKNLLYGISLTQENWTTDWNNINRWIGSAANLRTEVREYVNKVYLWKSAIQVSREMYRKLLS